MQEGVWVRPHSALSSVSQAVYHCSNLHIEDRTVWMLPEQQSPGLKNTCVAKLNCVSEGIFCCFMSLCYHFVSLCCYFVCFWSIFCFFVVIFHLFVVVLCFFAVILLASSCGHFLSVVVLCLFGHYSSLCDCLVSPFSHLVSFVVYFLFVCFILCLFVVTL